MNNELEEILAKAGMKKKDAAILIKLAKVKNISLGRAFFLYAWKYYAWSLVLLLAVIFSSLSEGIEFFVVNVLFCMAVALVSLFFTPFVINLIWSIKIQYKLLGK
ncbi:hypothetical protein HV096_00155 [Citrobacter freundii]|uniref:hypothetical protein n=2 Tax=Citrobacter TaxID=544 RepID=UPI0015E552E9|nr:hypothetical protein [Citrobacter freundii]EJB8473828.1 hypothetical protein [Citrobacter freundii]EJB8558340.1 hypothetical protein [Citrobacter freundii]MBA8030590.1 hypothetical protein [Citrobacter freundii]QLO05514.1 hypothetical protein HV141_19205 [Citrobacter freundii]QLU68169.1 hypothetical protein HV173_19140 [Citrobacter freundii]